MAKPQTKLTESEVSRADSVRSLLPADFLAVVGDYGERLDVELLALAFQYASEKHAGQKRRSGEDFIRHCVEVAKILSEIYLDSVSIAASLLHDVVEDTGTPLEEIREEFGDEIATIVAGLTKISRFRFGSLAEQQVENYRRLLLSMAKDARVIIVKLADRLHNMRTLEHLPEDKRRRVAAETREIYAPLAHRLGMARVRWELEDLAFKFLEPDEYRELVRRVAGKRSEREELVGRMGEPLSAELREAGLEAEVYGRPKHLWSIYRKMVKRNKPYEEIYDVLAMRVIVGSVRDCYHALGVIHNKWTPLTERFHDYVASPKSNLYQSLHTTIFGPGGRLYEIQIRTREMHRTAEYGIAAHWRYKEDIGGEDELDEQLAWFRQVLEWQQETREPEEFMEFLKIDLYQDEIFVFTPAGDVKQLPKGATPIDFAFAVHTEVGTRCAGARVNGRIAPLSRPLRNGDTVEIITSDSQTPSRDWLGFVRTSRARSKINQWIRREQYESAVHLGKEILNREWKRLRKRPDDDAVARAAGELAIEGGIEGLYAAVGRGDLGLTKVIRAVFPEEEEPSRDRAAGALAKLVERVRTSQRGIRIQGMDNLMVRYSQCCQPVPGDDVIGYITRGRGVSIHRSDCPNVLNLADRPERRVDIEWDSDGSQRFLVRLVLEGTDRHGLFADIARAISDTGTNIQSADIRSIEGGMRGQFVVEVENLTHLKKVMKQVRRVKGVLQVERRESVGESDLMLEAE
ncbi:MAG: bifunctional (p)ppGpp synthetase/guanosine-3',5'-bis(diphosphate) 3'-pyrophosphohydrolase [Gemmatimonadota bacterium]|jgi:GTP pyrophosphokinase|nr:MAG: bifunctional (p)ppGpp synthetase/guanosine-3',5'-bis(diphosphate) 3'-pyrophosphohydrolase [Gemmatimonadota bacterium]